MCYIKPPCPVVSVTAHTQVPALHPDLEGAVGPAQIPTGRQTLNQPSPGPGAGKEDFLEKVALSSAVGERQGRALCLSVSIGTISALYLVPGVQLAVGAEALPGSLPGCPVPHPAQGLRRGRRIIYEGLRCHPELSCRCRCRLEPTRDSATSR